VEEDINSYRVTLEKRRGYWKLKKDALNRAVWRIVFGRGCGTVVRQTAE